MKLKIVTGLIALFMFAGRGRTGYGTGRHQNHP
jgi:hypothetical protein